MTETSLLILIPAAALAGVLSFLSPCTLPILPAYFAIGLGGQGKSVVGMTVAFFLGLATTLVALGATATALSGLLFRNLTLLTTVGGILIVAFGVMSLFGWGFSGPALQRRPAATFVGSYIYGLTFAIGWTACLGPILGTILTLLATTGLGIAQGALLAFIYALGLSLPLLVVTLFFGRLGRGTGAWQWMRGRTFAIGIGGRAIDLHSTSVISGALSIGLGVLLATGQLTSIAAAAGGSPLSTWVVGLEEDLVRLLGLR